MCDARACSRHVSFHKPLPVLHDEVLTVWDQLLVCCSPLVCFPGEDQLAFVATISDQDASLASQAASRAGRGRRWKRCMLEDEAVLADFLEETLARIETRWVDEPLSRDIDM